MRIRNAIEAARIAREEELRRIVEEKKRAEEDERARREAEEKARREAEEKARLEAEMARLEVHSPIRKCQILNITITPLNLVGFGRNNGRLKTVSKNHLSELSWRISTGLSPISILIF